MQIMDRREIVIESNSCRVGLSEGQLVARNLGSDLLLILYADTLKLGMMVRARDQANNFEFVHSALLLIFSELQELGVPGNQLVVHAVGGANRNSRLIRLLEQALICENISFQGTDLGAEHNRAVYLDLSSGRLIVRSSSLSEADRKQATWSEKLAS